MYGPEDKRVSGSNVHRVSMVAPGLRHITSFESRVSVRGELKGQGFRFLSLY